MADQQARAQVAGPSGTALLAVGMVLWLAAMAAWWPVALSFSDEVGYVGHARLLLQGHLRPLADSPGYWIPSAHGWVSQYPLLAPLLMAPLMALNPKLIFLTGVIAALTLCWVASRALRAWGRAPWWGLVVLAHPTVIIVARTAMSDLLLSAFAVGGWWALRRDRRAAAVALLALTVAAKPTGFLIAGALVVGEAASLLPALRAGDRGARARVAWGAAGFAAGLALAATLNLLSAGKLWFAYDFHYLGVRPFWAGYVPSTTPRYFIPLLLLPPLLPAGAWSLWRRREFGPWLVVCGLFGLMCFYFFADNGRSLAETLVLAPRLILPVVSFLLIGYADGLAALATRLRLLGHTDRASAGRGRQRPPALALLLVVAPAVVAGAVSKRHHRWQEPGATALAASAALATARGGTLGLTLTACKAGLLFDGRTVLTRDEHGAPPIVLCNTQSSSYRAPIGEMRCDLPGYTTQATSTTFRILTRGGN